MMGQRKSEPQLFNYAVNLEKRVRANHPLRRVKAAIDLSFVREEVAHCYGHNGNESVAPAVILKMMFLLFFDDIASERELMLRDWGQSSLLTLVIGEEVPVSRRKISQSFPRARVRSDRDQPPSHKATASQGRQQG